VISPLDLVCTLGQLIDPTGYLDVRRSGAWSARWCNRRGDTYQHAAATYAEAAMFALSEDMCEAGLREALAYLEEGSQEGREAAEAIRLVLIEAEWCTDVLDDEMLNAKLDSAEAALGESRR
jgi:hypothetical protein